MAHYLMFYELVPDYVERRKAFRADHLALAWRAHEAGELVLGGILDEPVDRAVLFFQGDSPDVARRFAEVRSLRDQRTRGPVGGAPVDHRGRHPGRDPGAARGCARMRP